MDDIAASLVRYDKELQRTRSMRALLRLHDNLVRAIDAMDRNKLNVTRDELERGLDGINAEVKLLRGK